MNGQQPPPLIHTPFSKALDSAKERLLSIVDICSGIPEASKPGMVQAINRAFFRFGNAPSDEVLPWIKKTRRETLNLFELAVGTKHPLWPLLRTQLFGVFGPDGLEGEIFF